MFLLRSKIFLLGVQAMPIYASRHAEELIVLDDR